METLRLEGGDKTPLIQLENTGQLHLSGRSIPENTIEFYKPVFEWLENYSGAPATNTVLTVQLEYFNTSSSKCLLDLFRIMETIHGSGKSKVTIIWVYEEEDEDMMEAGEDYKSIVSIDFVLKQID